MGKNWGRTPVSNADKRHATQMTYLVGDGESAEERIDRRPMGKVERFVDRDGNVCSLQMYSEGDPKRAETEQRNRAAYHRKDMVEHAKCPIRTGTRHASDKTSRDFAKMPASLAGECKHEIRVMAQSSDTGLREQAVAKRMGGRQPQSMYDARELDGYFPDHPLSRVRATLDEVVGSVEIVSLPERPAEVVLAEPGCAITAPTRFVKAPPIPGSGRGELVRIGVDDWQRTIEVWRMGRHKLKGKDLHAALVEHANKSANATTTKSAPIDDFGVCLQIQQYVTLERDEEPYHAVYRWWIAGDGTLWRIGEVAPVVVDREGMASEVAAVQDSFRRT
jgi:hypothetical protein